MKEIRFCLLFLLGAVIGVWGGASQRPFIYTVQGNVPNRLCGNIRMPSDWQEIVPENHLSLKPDQKDQERGYLIFHKHYMEKTTPYTLPMRHELARDLKLFACPGEYEPVTFFLRSLRPLKDIQVTVTDLVSKEGNILEALNIDVRAALALPFRHPAHSKKYTMKNEILIRKKNYSLEMERTLQYWLTIYVPSATPGGRYQGKVLLTVDGKRQALPLLLRVFPVEIQENKDVELGMYLGRHEHNFKIRRQYYHDMRAHGMNTMAPCNVSVSPKWRGGRIVLDYTMMDEEMALYREAGFSKPVALDMRPVEAWLSYLQRDMAEFRKAGKAFPADHVVDFFSYDISPTFSEFEAVEYKKMIRQIVAHAKEADWPPIYFLPQEEATNKGVRVQQQRRFAQLLKECGVRVTSWSNGTWGSGDDLQDIDAYVDVRYYNGVDAKIRERTKKSGDFFGIYNHGDRMMFGFFGEKVQAEGMLQWAYIFSPVRHMLDSGVGGYGGGMIYPGDCGPLPSPNWEIMREGIDDNRCIYTLKKLIAKYRNSTDKAFRTRAGKAQKVLEDILAQIPDDTRGVSELAKNMDPAQLDVWRFKLIRQIMNLQQADTGSDQASVGKKACGLVAGIVRKQMEKTASSKQESKAPGVVVPYAGKVSFNGEMKGDGWNQAVKISPFVLTEVLAWDRARALASSDIGKVRAMPASQPTVVRLVYDDKAIYAGFRCHESQMSKIVALTKKHDGEIFADDAVELFFKPSLNEDVYYQIASNSLGVSADTKWLWTGTERKVVEAWNPAVETKVIKGRDYWQCVIRVPFASMGFSEKPADGSIWYGQFSRDEQPVPGCEYSSWTLVHRSFHELHRWGTLYFNRIPAAVISGIDSRELLVGKNSLSVGLMNNRPEPFQGSMTIQIHGKGRCASEVPLKCTGKQECLSVPFEVFEEGPLDVKLTLKDKSGAALFNTLCHYDVPVPMKMNLMSTEVADDKLGVHVEVNLSKKVVSRYSLRCLVSSKNISLEESVALTGSGKHQVYINTESLKPGAYQLTIQMIDDQDKGIVTEKRGFEVLERVF